MLNEFETTCSDDHKSGRAHLGAKVIAPSIGNFQARVLLSVFYFVLVPPFALIGAAALLKPE